MKKVKMTRGNIESVNPKIGNIKDEDIKQALDYTDRFNRLRSDSGNIEYSDTLTTFFYLLLRDYLSAGKVEKLVNEVVNDPEVCLFTNGFLAQYADNLAGYMREAKTKALAKALEDAFVSSDDKANEELLKEPKKKGRASLGSDDEELSKLKGKVDEAVENMTDEEKKELEEDKVTDEEALEELVKYSEKFVSVKEDVPSREVGLFDHEKRKSKVVSEVFKKANSQDRKEWLKKNVDDPVKSKQRTNIFVAMEALDGIKGMVPSDSVEQIVDILKTEIKSELTDDVVEEIQTRESILEKRAEENAEHKSPDPDAEQKAVEFVKEKVAEQIRENLTHIIGEEDTVSRGNLSDVVDGRAFPEALDKVFEEPKKPVEMTMEEKLEGVKQKYVDKVNEMDEKNVKTGVFKRVE